MILLGGSFIVAVMAALGIHWLARRSASTRLGSTLQSMTLSIAVALAVFVGFVFLRGGVGWPEQYWHWLPFVGLATALMGSRLWVIAWVWRLAAFGVMAGLCAWMLVPTWSNLEPGRFVFVPLLTLYFVVLFVLYGCAAERASERQNLVALIITAMALAISVAAVFSLEYGQVGLAVASSLVACLVTDRWVNLERVAVQGLMPCVAILLGGLAFASFVYPQPPVHEFLLVPFAPAALWFAKSDANNADSTIGFWKGLVPYFVLLGAIVAVIVFRH